MSNPAAHLARRSGAFTGGAIAAPARSVEALAAEFEEYIEGKSAPTRRAYGTAIGRLLEWLRGDYSDPPRPPRHRPTRSDIIEYREWLAATHRNSTARQYLAAAKTFFGWLAATGRYPNITDQVDLPRTPPAFRREPLAAGQVREILAARDGDALAALRDRAIITLMATTGLRCIEVSRADLGDLRTVCDPRTGATRRALYIQRKGRAEATEFILLSTHAAEALDAYQARRRGEAMRTGEAIGDGAPLFAALTSHRGGRMATRSISRVAKDAMRAAGYDRRELTAHSLRHTAATLALANGESLEAVQSALGHADSATTRIYIHYNARAAATVEQTVDRAIFGDNQETSHD